ncbi:hypothetical protein V1525DRAFT_398465 [Lipomyces kononenkoae]|uniref:Uncharacterized protein n=1 Tax=Lipomyces kononenkoae TaxID=34357 RepID=A0ACC3T6J2_LIPKO
MAARHVPLLDLSRPFRATHDELLLWSLRSCWATFCHTQTSHTKRPSPLIGILYPERTIAFMRKTAQYLELRQKRLLKSLYAHQRHYNQARSVKSDASNSQNTTHATHNEASQSTQADNTVSSIPRIPPGITKERYWSDQQQSHAQRQHAAAQVVEQEQSGLDEEWIPESYLKIPDDPDRRFMNLMRITRSYNIRLADTAFRLWRLCLTSITTRVQIMTERVQVYNFFRESNTPEGWHRMILIFNDVSESQRTELDFRFRLWALLRLELGDAADAAFVEGAARFPSAMDMQWSMINRYYTRREEFNRALLLWATLMYHTDPKLRHNRRQTENTMRELLIKCHDHAELIGQVIERYSGKDMHQFGNRFARIAISILADLGSPKISKDVYMRMHGRKSNRGDLARVVRILNRAGMADESSQLIKAFEVDYPEYSSTDLIIGTKLETLAASKDYNAMQELFENVIASGSQPSAYHYNVTMHALGEIGQVGIVNRLLEDMREKHMKVPIQVIATVMWSRSKVGDLEGAIELFETIGEYGLRHNDVVYNIALSVYNKLDDAENMFQTFRRMLRDDIVPTKRHITTLMSLFAKRGDVERSEAMVQLLQHFEIEPDAAVFNVLAAAYIQKSHDMNTVSKNILRRMRQADVFPDTRLFATLLHGFARAHDSAGLKHTIEQMKSLSVPMDSVTFGIMIHYLGVANQLPAAENVFNQLEGLGIERDVFHYTALMTAYLYHGNTGMVQRKYKDMIAEGIAPSFITLLTLMLSYRDRRKHYAAESLLMMIDGIMDRLPSLDMTNPVSSKTTIPAYIFTPILRLYHPLGTRKYAQVIEKFNRVNESRDFADQIQPDPTFEAQACIAAARAGDWTTVHTHWRRFLGVTLLRFRDYDPYRNKYCNQIKGINRALFGDALTSKMDALIATEQYEEVETLWQQMRDLDIKFSNRNWNARVRAIARTDNRVFDAMEIAENKLVDGYLKIRKHKDTVKWASDKVFKVQLRRQKPKVRYYLQNRTVSFFSDLLQEKFDIEAEQLAGNPQEFSEYQRLRRRFRKIFAIVYEFRFRQKMKRQMLKRLGKLRQKSIEYPYYKQWRHHQRVTLNLRKGLQTTQRRRIEEVTQLVKERGQEIGPEMRYAIWKLSRVNKKTYGEQVALLRSIGGTPQNTTQPVHREDRDITYEESNA